MLKNKLCILTACVLSQSCYATIEQLIELTNQYRKSTHRLSATQEWLLSHLIQSKLGIDISMKDAKNDDVIDGFIFYCNNSKVRASDRIDTDTLTTIFQEEKELLKCAIHIFILRKNQERLIQLIDLMGNSYNALSDSEKTKFNKIITALLQDKDIVPEIKALLEVFIKINNLSKDQLFTLQKVMCLDQQHDLTKKILEEITRQFLETTSLQDMHCMHAHIITLIAIKKDRQVIGLAIEQLNQLKTQLNEQNRKELVDSLISKLQSKLAEWPLWKTWLCRVLLVLLTIFIMIIWINIINIWMPMPSIFSFILFT